MEPRQSRSGTRVKGGKFKERTARALPTTLAPTHHRLSSYIDGRALRNASTGLELARASFTKCRVYRRIFREFRALISGFSIRDETRRDATRRGEARRARAASGRRAGIHHPETLHRQISRTRLIETLKETRSWKLVRITWIDAYFDPRGWDIYSRPLAKVI